MLMIAAPAIRINSNNNDGKDRLYKMRGDDLRKVKAAERFANSGFGILIYGYGVPNLSNMIRTCKAV